MALVVLLLGLAPRRPSALVAVIAVLAGVASAVSPAAPTTVAGADLVFKFAFGAGLAILSIATPPALVLLIAAAVALASTSAAPAVATGTALAAALSARRPPAPVSAAVGGVVAFALVHMKGHAPARELAIGAAASIVLLIAGLRDVRRPHAIDPAAPTHPPADVADKGAAPNDPPAEATGDQAIPANPAANPAAAANPANPAANPDPAANPANPAAKAAKAAKAALATVAVLAAAATAAAGLAMLLAAPDLRAGTAAAQAGLAAAATGNRPQTIDHLDAAAAHLNDADGWLSSPWAQPARLVPIVGQHLQAVRAVAHHGAALSRTGARTATNANTDAVRLRQGTIDTNAIAALEVPFEQAHAHLATAATSLRHAQSPWLAAPLDHRFAAFQRKVAKATAELATATDTVKEAPNLLGANGLRRYFLAVQTPSELRGSGGFIGNFGEIEADHGHLRLTRLGRTGDLNTASSPTRPLHATADFAALYGRFNPQRLWQNVTVSPDYPSDAALIADLYPQSGGKPLDGVINIDPDGLAAFLRLIGPVSVPAWPEPITAANTHHILLFDQYVKLQGQQRVDFLGEVAAKVWQGVTTTDLPSPPTIAAALGPAVRAKRIQIWSAHPDEERFFRTIHADGALPPPNRTDVLAVVSHNANPSKIDWFLHRSVDYRAGTNANGERTATARITLRNDAPAAGPPDYIIGNLEHDPPGSNLTYLFVYTPLHLRGVTLDGQPSTLEPATDLGYHVYLTRVLVPQGGQVTFELTLGGTEPPCRALLVHRQPTASPDDLTVTIDGHTTRRTLDEDITAGRC